MISRRIIHLMLAFVFAASLAACGDTWRGAKQDTGENLNRTGEAIDDAGDSVKD